MTEPDEVRLAAIVPSSNLRRSRQIDGRTIQIRNARKRTIAASGAGPVASQDPAGSARKREET